MEIAKAFEIITGKVDGVLLGKGYEKHAVADTDNEKTVLYTGEVAYSIVYYFDKKRVLLRSCAVTDGEPDNAWKTIATWLFDEESDSIKEAENIGEDFAETIRGPNSLTLQFQRVSGMPRSFHCASTISSTSVAATTAFPAGNTQWMAPKSLQARSVFSFMPPLPRMTRTPVILTNSYSNFSMRMEVVGPTETISNLSFSRGRMIGPA